MLTTTRRAAAVLVAAAAVSITGLVVQAGTQDALALGGNVWGGTGITAPAEAVDGAAAVAGTDSAAVAGVSAGASALTWGQGAAAFGVGFFSGCELMGWIANVTNTMQGQSCSGGFQVIGGWLGFGTGGDDRSKNSTNATGTAPCTASLGSFAPTTTQSVCVPFSYPNTANNIAYIASCKWSDGTTVGGKWIGGQSSSSAFGAATTALQATVDSSSASATGCDNINGVIRTGGVLTDLAVWYWGTYTSGLGTSRAPTAGELSTGTVIGQWHHDWTPNAPLTSKVTATCSNGVTVSATITWTPTAGGTAPAVKMPACPTGSAPTKVDTSTGRNGTPGDVTTSTNVFTPTSISNYPLCAGGSDSPCLLQPNKEVNGSPKPCISGTTDCTDWQNNPNPASEYTCTWGNYTVPLDWCTTNYPTSQPLPTGQATGTTTSTNTGTGGSTTTDPTTDPFPTTGANPGGDPVPDPGPTSNPTGSNCWGSGWSWDPISWVYVPVKCALMWAFVPDQATLEQAATNVKDGWSDTAVGRWIGSVATVVDAFPTTDNGDCQGPAWTFSTAQIGTHTLYPWSACADPEKTVADYVHTGLTALLWVAAFILCVKQLGAAVGMPITLGAGGGEAA